MLRIASKSTQKTAALPGNTKISLDGTEEQIFNFIRSACEDIGSITGQSPTARVAGGWVRDKFLGRASKDIDITVDNMGGDKFSEWLYKIAVQRYGEQQTVVTEAKTTEERPEQIKNLAVAFLRIFGQDVEILPLRGKEVYEEGNRNPVSTQAASPEDDAFRRDLTINTLFYNINNGQVEDFTGQGYDDLQSMTLRTPTRPGHDPKDEAARILAEDPLRLLRIIRFNSRYSSSNIAPEVIEAMKNPDVQHQLVRRLHGDDTGGIVPERTSEELRKTMVGEQPEKALRIMYETGLLGKMLNLPSEYSPLDMDQSNKHHELSLINHTLLVVKNMNKLSKDMGLPDEERMMMNLSSLFHDLGKLDPSIQKDKGEGQVGYGGHEKSSTDIWSSLSKSLKLTTKEQNFVQKVVSQHMVPHEHLRDKMLNDPNALWNKLREFKDTNPEAIYFYMHAMADSISKSEDDNPPMDERYQQNIDFMQDSPLPTLLNGNEIMQITGLKGQDIGRVLREIRKQQYSNFGLGGQQEIPIEQAREFATQIAKGFIKPLLNGGEIMQITGLKPGPEIGNITQMILKQQYDNPGFNRNDAINLVQQRYPQQQLPPEQV